MANKGKPVYDGLIARGFTPVQAATLAGNIQQESSFDPGVVNKTSGAKGLVQWLGPRKDALDQYAAATGRSPDDTETQLDFIVHEMQGPEAKNSADFLSSTDVPTANEAIKKYFRYGPNEGGNRLDYALSFAGQPGDQPAAAAPADGGFVNPGFSGGIPGAEPFNPIAPPAPLSPDTMNTPQGISDEDLLKSFLGPAAPPTTGAPSTNPDDEFLKQFLTAPGGTEQAAAPDALAGTQQLFPGADALSAFFSRGVDAIDVVGHPLMDTLVGIKAKMNGRTKEQQWAIERGIQEQQPVASTAGDITGKVAPYLALGATALGGKMLGTAGTLAERIAASGLSSATIQGADTISRGGTPEEAAKSAMEGGVLGAGLGGLGGKLIARTLGGAAMGGGVTALEGGSPEDIQRNALLGAGAGAALHGAAAGANRLLSGTSESIAKLAQTARDKFGIQVGASQLSANPLVRTAASTVDRLPFSGGTAAKSKQLSGFYKALANEMGENADTLTPDVMAAARDRIGNVFESVAQRVPVIKSDAQFQNDLLQAATDAESTLDAAKQAPVIKQFENIVNTFGKGGQITGDQYLSLTAKNSILSKAIAQGGDVGMVASQMKDALYGALERSAPADVAKDLQKARYQWKVMRTLENPAAKSPTGEISPALLMAPVIKNFGGKAFGQAGNMGELADIGQQFLKEPGTSNTAERAATMLGIDKVSHLVAPTAVAGGIAALANPGALTSLAAAAPALVAAPLVVRGVGAALRSKALANKLIGNALKTAPSTAASPVSIAARAAVPLLAGPGGPLPGGPLRIVVRPGADAAGNRLVAR